MLPGLVTDSASALPIGVCAALGIGLVDLRVTVDETDLPDRPGDQDWFWDRLDAGARVTTSQPAPRDLLRVYREIAAAGVERAWSLHIGSHLSGTLNAARLAAESCGLPVRLVDTGTASMPQGLCVLAGLAGLVGDPGADVAAIAATEAATQENIFVSLAPRRVAGSGRAEAGITGPLAVLSLRHGAPMQVVGEAEDMSSAIDLMRRRAQAFGSAGTIAVGNGGASAWAGALADAVGDILPTDALVRYSVPPSIGAHTGRTVGLVMTRTVLPAAILDLFRQCV